jgi:16S rRNA (uracil1498-N3)-methyltransferase
VLLSPAGTLRASELPRSDHIAMLIGPEGGLSENEQEAAVAAGFQQVRMGPRVLRTETAAIAALAALQHDFGDI